jgi:hypothetical protein
MDIPVWVRAFDGGDNTPAILLAPLFFVILRHGGVICGHVGGIVVNLVGGEREKRVTIYIHWSTTTTIQCLVEI